MKQKATKLLVALLIIAVIAGVAICGRDRTKDGACAKVEQTANTNCRIATDVHKGQQNIKAAKVRKHGAGKAETQQQLSTLEETYKKQLEQFAIFKKAQETHEALYAAYYNGSTDAAGLIEQCKAEEENAKKALEELKKLRDERIAIINATTKDALDISEENSLYNNFEITLGLLTVEPAADNKLLLAAKKSHDETEKMLAEAQQSMSAVTAADLTDAEKAVFANEVIPDGQNVQKGLGEFLNELVKVAQQIVQVVQQLQSGGAKGLGIGMAKSLISGGKSGTNPIAIINSITKLFNSLAESTVSMNKSINGYNQAAGKLAGVEVVAAPELQAPDFSQILKLAH